MRGRALTPARAHRAIWFDMSERILLLSKSRRLNESGG
jgi:hypothetical protein